jgi:hypothetical protein
MHWWVSISIAVDPDDDWVQTCCHEKALLWHWDLSLCCTAVLLLVKRRKQPHR